MLLQKSWIVLASSLASLLVTVPASPAHASQPATWNYADENDFRRGNLDGLALHPTLGLSTAPKLTRTAVEADFIHCWLRDGSKLWLGTGLEGRIFVFENGAVREVAKIDAPLVTSMVSDGAGGIYAALVGKGEIVHVGSDFKLSPFVKLTDINHVWALVKKGGTLFAGTGPGGKVMAIDIATKVASLYAETGADHVLALIADGDGLIAGTSDAALLLRISGEKQVRALASFPGVEVRSILRQGKYLYAVVNGGATAVPLASLKPTAERPGTGAAVKPASGNKTGKEAAAKGKGAVWRRGDDGITTRVFISPEGMLSEIGSVGKTIVAGAARGGRVVIGDDFGDVQSLFDLKEEEVLGIEMGAKGPVSLLTGKSAAVYSVGTGDGPAIFTTEVLQETGTALWGRVETVGEGDLTIESRSGFSDTPNDTWSPWQELQNGIIQSPPATCLQVRVKLGSAQSRLTELKINRQVANRTPLVSKIDTVTDKRKGSIAVSWAAEDPDGDELAFTVQYRPRGTKQWLMLHDRLYTKKTMELAPTDMPDGWYEMRVEVTDVMANGPKTAKATARISKPFLVDRGHPEATAEVRGRLVQGVAYDATSKVTRVEVSLDGAPAQLAASRDGIYDQQREAFDFELGAEATQGHHTVLITVTDEAGNTGALRLSY